MSFQIQLYFILLQDFHFPILKYPLHIVHLQEKQFIFRGIGRITGVASPSCY